MSPKTLFFVYFYQNPLNILGFDILWSLVSKYVKIYLFLFFYCDRYASWLVTRVAASWNSEYKHAGETIKAFPSIVLFIEVKTVNVDRGELEGAMTRLEIELEHCVFYKLKQCCFNLLVLLYSDTISKW